MQWKRQRGERCRCGMIWEVSWYSDRFDREVDDRTPNGKEGEDEEGVFQGDVLHGAESVRDDL